MFLILFPRPALMEIVVELYLRLFEARMFWLFSGLVEGKGKVDVKTIQMSPLWGWDQPREVAFLFVALSCLSYIYVNQLYEFKYQNSSLLFTSPASNGCLNRFVLFPPFVVKYNISASVTWIDQLLYFIFTCLLIVFRTLCTEYFQKAGNIWLAKYIRS